ncbi:Uncharacterised protein [Salmonella enterica subsp. enterica serovar Bovismorbificans]|uniref:Uncharacterized protein n=1 Tax=Salmonella enterica subsp. enterica serovar Bovismorbificans TaxID=58097 RepID=A0A655EP72_SALET|nr:Uncharacterised protein [Salmonella enterica subsp. enterica serovar Bovismorbificans]CNV29325.1 Uncharacterised protein [Salmonella enterica subsp. enterica serovar Bovismorbificans]
MVVGFYQRDCSAFATRTACTTNAMQIGIATARHVEVNDVADVRNINPACRDVGRDQDVNAAVGETLNTFVTFDLRHLAFKIAIVDPCQTQRFSQFMDAFTFTYKHDRTGCIVLF